MKQQVMINDGTDNDQVNGEGVNEDHDDENIDDDAEYNHDNEGIN